MKRLTNVYDRNELATVRSLLQSRGVPTYVGFRRFTTEPFVLFVCIDSQFEDALALMQNPRHSVAHPVDAHVWEQAANRASSVAILKGALLVLLALILLTVLAVAMRTWLGSHA